MIPPNEAIATGDVMNSSASGGRDLPDRLVMLAKIFLRASIFEIPMVPIKTLEIKDAAVA